MRRRLVVMDGFYANPDSVRQLAREAAYREEDGLVGWRSRPFCPRGIKRRIERHFGLRIVDWPVGSEAQPLANGVFFKAFSTGRFAEKRFVHSDFPTEWFTLIIYLTPSAPVGAGTSFYSHTSTGLVEWPTRRIARKLGRGLEPLTDQLDRESGDFKRWTEIDRVGNVFNRGVLFGSGMFHAASSHFGGNLRRGRVFQLFRFGAEREAHQT